tara:strand:+ start:90 stop:560 length:471 start_codon:yes stop_codon:yes gene_type:complete
MKKCYIASGWFSPEWNEELENIKSVLDRYGLDYFSPKDENLCDPDSSEGFQDQVFEGNIKGMKECDWMICNTRNKDMGSIFEAGYFHHENKPIVYFCAGLPVGAQFNLMLAASGVSVCTSIDDLRSYLADCIECHVHVDSETAWELVERRYAGKIE